MKLRHIDLERVIKYPSLLNPFVLVTITLLVLEMLLLSWWRYDEKHIAKGKVKSCKFYLKKNGIEREELFIMVICSTVNTWWWNSTKSLAYAKYVNIKWEMGWSGQSKAYRTEQIEDAFEYYQEICNRIKSGNFVPMVNNEFACELKVPNELNMPLVERETFGTYSVYVIHIGDVDILMDEQMFVRYLDAGNKMLER